MPPAAIIDEPAQRFLESLARHGRPPRRQLKPGTLTARSSRVRRDPHWLRNTCPAHSNDQSLSILIAARRIEFANPADGQSWIDLPKQLHGQGRQDHGISGAKARDPRPAWPSSTPGAQAATSSGGNMATLEASIALIMSGADRPRRGPAWVSIGAYFSASISSGQGGPPCWSIGQIDGFG